MRARILTSAALLASLGLAACVDVRGFEGSWTGAVVSEEAIRQGFATTARVDALALKNVDLQGLTASLTTTDGKFNDTALKRVVKFSNDTLSSLTFDGDPLRSYLHYATLASEPDGPPAQILISLFGDDHVELRIIRGNDLFGVFNLQRKSP